MAYFYRIVFYVVEFYYKLYFFITVYVEFVLCGNLFGAVESFLGGYVKFYCLFIVIIVLLVNIVCFRLLVLFVCLFVILLLFKGTFSFLVGWVFLMWVLPKYYYRFGLFYYFILFVLFVFF